MYPELLSFGPFTIYTYGLMIAIGILAAYTMTERRAKACRCERKYLDPLLFTVLIAGFAGAKLLYLLTDLPAILQDPAIIWRDFGSGWVVYGGLIGGILGGYFYLKHKGQPFLPYFDWLIPGVALAQAFGRLGCFFAGCCYGVEVHNHFGIVFPEGGMAPAGVMLFPTQLLSSLFDFALTAFLIWIARRKTWNGEVGAWYLVLYALGRFAIEFFRGDMIRGYVGALSTSQFISLFAFAAGLVLIFVMHHRSAKAGGKQA